jgi:hypothetical protein
MTSKHMSPNHREALTAVSSITGLDEYLLSTNGVLDSAATISGQAIPASGLTTAVAVQIVDGSGNQIASFGGGTQYIDGGVPPAHPTGTTIEWSDGANWQTVSTAKPLPVTASFSPSGTQDVNLKQINGNTTSVGNGITGTGSQRVTIASDNTAFSVNATLSAETTKVIGTVNQGTSPWVVAGNVASGSSDSGNPVKVGGVNMTTPPTLTDAQRGDLQLDTRANAKTTLFANNTATAITVSATNADGRATSATASRFEVVNDNNIYNGTTYDRQASIINATNSVGTGIAAAGVLAQFDDVAPTAITENQFGNLRMSANRNLYNTIRDAAGNERGANVNASNQMSVSIDGTNTVTQSTSPWIVAGGGTAGAAATGVVTIQGIASMTKLLVTPDANSSVNLAQVGGTNTVNGGVAGSQSVGGTVATNVAITANPLNLGAQAISSENSAVTTARQVQLVADLVGKLIVLPYANPENFVSGTATATDTTSTSLIASPGGSLRNYITQFTVWNSSATNTYIKIQDGSGGTTLYTLPCPTVGGSVITLPTPLRQPTTATAIFFAANASANAVFISASGYKGL